MWVPNLTNLPVSSYHWTKMRAGRTLTPIFVQGHLELDLQLNDFKLSINLHFIFKMSVPNLIIAPTYVLFVIRTRYKLDRTTAATFVEGTLTLTFHELI